MIGLKARVSFKFYVSRFQYGFVATQLELLNTFFHGGCRTVCPWTICDLPRHSTANSHAVLLVDGCPSTAISASGEFFPCPCSKLLAISLLFYSISRKPPSIIHEHVLGNITFVSPNPLYPRTVRFLASTVVPCSELQRSSLGTHDVSFLPSQSSPYFCLTFDFCTGGDQLALENSSPRSSMSMRIPRMLHISVRLSL